MPDQLVLARPWDDVYYRDPVTDGVIGPVGQHDPHLPLRTTPPALAGPVRSPHAVHPQVAVHGDVGRDADQQVLAARDDVVDVATAEVDGGVARNAKVAAGERAAGERLTEATRRQVHRVALRHASMVPDGRHARPEGPNDRNSAPMRRCSRRSRILMARLFLSFGTHA